MSDSDPCDDQELLDALGRGEARALDELYARHGTVVYRMALRAAGQASDAADATQEAFLHVLDRAGGLRLTGSLATYLYPVVTRLARRLRERAGRAQGGAALEEAVQSLVASEEPSEDREALAHALARLSDTLREALLLRYADGLSYPEAAAALGCPEGTVRRRVHDALQALRDDPGARRLIRD